ncbi:Ig-like domain-containing protein [Hymenobacter metallicola]|uniref:Fibronectin type-III domain-containing protein n=1 Tax=Hymenobacter metallicola TaxID=2563114 RepID=A0A4Z0QI24_9BACT|nr:Ig-like domain-containing protein [Hymenobacter metallicola]TGE29728.1 hypothetical protein E5K02_09795 [Hymenobacter metallicola]
MDQTLEIKTAAQIQAELVQLSLDLGNTLQPGANVGGPVLGALLTRQAVLVADLCTLQVSQAAALRYGSGVPLNTLGVNNDLYRNTLTGDEYQKVNGAYVLRLNLKGQPGYTPVKNRDYFDGKDGKDGVVTFLETYAPENELGSEGNLWIYVNTTDKTATHYKKVRGKWRLIGAAIGGGLGTAPTNQNPVVAISTPVAGATATAGTLLNLVAVATDDVSVSSVDFLNAGGVVLAPGTKNGNQYTATITVPNTPGTFGITAKATDGAGLTNTATVNITIQAATPANTAPVVSISSPAAGATVTAGTSLPLSATATDDVSVSSVEFYNAAGALLAPGVKNGNQYTASITVPNTPGAFIITAKALDGAGLTNTAAVSITIQAAVATALPAPQNVQATAISSSAISIAWSPVPNATGYALEAALTANGSYTEIYRNTSTNYTHGGLPASSPRHYRVKALGTGANADSPYSVKVNATTQAVPSTYNKTILALTISQSNGSTLGRMDTRPAGQFETEYTAMQTPRTRAFLFNETTQAIEPISRSNGRCYTASEAELALIGGAELLAIEFEKRSTGKLFYNNRWKNGSPITDFAKTAPDTYYYNSAVSASIETKEAFVAAGGQLLPENIKLGIWQGETWADLDNWIPTATEWTDNFTDDVGLPDGCDLIVVLPKTQTDFHNVAQARVNIAQFAATYTRHNVLVWDAEGMNLQDEPEKHHYDFPSHVLRAQQMVALWMGETITKTWVSERKTASCGAGTTGPDVVRQAFSTVNLADANTKAQTLANADLQCEVVVSDADPDYPYLHVRKQEITATQGITVTNTNTITATGFVGGNGSTQPRFAKHRYGWRDNTQHPIIAYQRFKLVDIAQLIGPETDGQYANQGVNQFLYGARSGTPNYSNDLEDIHFGTYVKVSSSAGQVDVGANMFTVNNSPAFDPRALVGKYLRIVYEQTRTILLLEGATRAQDVVLSVEKYRMETGPSIVMTPTIAWLWQGCRIEDISLAAVTIVDFSAPA